MHEMGIAVLEALKEVKNTPCLRSSSFARQKRSIVRFKPPHDISSSILDRHGWGHYLPVSSTACHTLTRRLPLCHSSRPPPHAENRRISIGTPSTSAAPSAVGA